MPDEFATGLTAHTVRVGERDREFLLYLPESHQAGRSLVFAFHGAGSSARDMVDFCAMNATADVMGFAVVYPNGTGRAPNALSWNAGAVNVWSARNQIDDIGFTEAMLDRLLDHLEADEHRVYATGMSNGGLLCFRLACDLADRLAAIAPVAVSLVNFELQPRLPMPIVHFHGTADDFVNYEGGMGRKSMTQTSFVAVEEAMKFWAEFNGCCRFEQTDLDIGLDAETAITRHRYFGGDAEVMLYQIHGGGHTWPGVPSRYSFLGPVTQNLSANETIWDFFRNQAR